MHSTADDTDRGVPVIVRPAILLRKAESIRLDASSKAQKARERSVCARATKHAISFAVGYRDLFIGSILK